jgi:hypothetical protein
MIPHLTHFNPEDGSSIFLQNIAVSQSDETNMVKY